MTRSFSLEHRTTPSMHMKLKSTVYSNQTLNWCPVTSTRKGIVWRNHCLKQSTAKQANQQSLSKVNECTNVLKRSTSLSTYPPSSFLSPHCCTASYIRRLMTTRRRSPHVPCQHRTVKIQTQRPSASGAVGWLKFCSCKLSLVSEPNYYSRICTSQLQFFFS